MNYIYSILIRSHTNEEGIYNDYANQIGFFFCMFGIGAAVNLVLYPFLRHPGVLMFGILIGPVIGGMLNLLLGFTYLESVKQYSYIKANILLYLFAILFMIAYSLPAVFYMNGY